MDETDKCHNFQRQHFERIHSDYVEAYDDEFSLFYKRALIYRRIALCLNSIPKSKLNLLEVACGSGMNSEELKKLTVQPLHLVGVDISAAAVQEFKSRHGLNSAFEYDFTRENINVPNGPFDVILILGGIHHMIKSLDHVFHNLHANLVDDGTVIFVEPNRLFLNPIRQWWYRRDAYFDGDNEAAIDHQELLGEQGKLFRMNSVSYFGGPGFFLILQSLILRTPRIIKKLLYRPLTVIDERLTDALPPHFLPAFIAVWSKRQNC